MVATLRHRLKQVEAENRELRRQLEVVYGQLHKQQGPRIPQGGSIPLDEGAT